MRKKINSGSTFEDQIAYSRAIVDGNWIFVSGTTGYDYQNMTIADDVIKQAEQCFKNISKTLKEAESKLDDIVRITYILPEATDFEKCWPTIRKYLGEIKPAATMFTAGLATPEMKIEIQVTALKNS